MPDLLDLLAGLPAVHVCRVTMSVQNSQLGISAELGIFPAFEDPSHEHLLTVAHLADLIFRQSLTTEFTQSIRQRLTIGHVFFDNAIRQRLVYAESITRVSGVSVEQERKPLVKRCGFIFLNTDYLWPLSDSFFAFFEEFVHIHIAIHRLCFLDGQGPHLVIVFSAEEITSVDQSVASSVPHEVQDGGMWFD
jgi:hypothetical protein